MSLNRRQFLALSGGAAVTGAAAWAGLLRERSSGSPSHPAGGAAGRVLVVVQLSGGNDALDTLVPHDGRYHDLRPDLAVPDEKLVALSGASGYGLHPSLAPLTSLWDKGQLAIVPDVGFAADSRSHFESLASWWTASPEHTHQTGWIGRWLDSGDAGDDPLTAVSLGGGAVPALTSERSQSTAVNDLAEFRLQTTKATGDAVTRAFLSTAGPAATDPLLAQAQAAVTSAGRAVDVLSRAGSTGSTGTSAVEGDDPGGAATGPITSGLGAAAHLIGLGVGTRVVLVSASGFDTHAGEKDVHARLLADLATGITGFFTAVESSGHADDVLLLTTSEFGRRAAQNGSGGTDHGHGGVHFVAGHHVRAGIHGDVDLGHLADGDLPAAVDARELYAAGLDWLGGPSAEILDGHRDTMGLTTA